MEVLQIPISSNAAHFEQENEIFKKSYALEFEWIEREGFWMLHVADAQEKPIAQGLKLQPNWPMIALHRAVLILLPNKATDILNRASLQSSFTLVAYAAL